MKDTPITGRNTEEEIGTRTTITGRKRHTFIKTNTTQRKKDTPIQAALKDLLIIGYWNTPGR